MTCSSFTPRDRRGIRGAHHLFGIRGTHHLFVLTLPGEWVRRMARMARIVVLEYPHHVTQRGVRSLPIFRDDEDRQSYLEFMSRETQRFRVRILAGCLMTNHVHLIAVPEGGGALARAIGEAHKRYSRMRNFAEGVRGICFNGGLGRAYCAYWMRNTWRRRFGMWRITRFEWVW